MTTGTGSDTSTPAEGTEHPMGAAEGTATPSAGALVGSVIRRELFTVILTPTVIVLGLLTTAIVAGLAVVGGGYRAGYVAVVVDLLTPLQLLVPVLAVALGYNAVLSDQRRGELDVLRTYPLRPWQFVTGVYLGRAAGLAAILTFPLLVVLGLTAVGGTPRLPMYASHSAGDSPGLYLRMVVLTVAFGLVVLAVAVAVSALVSSARTALIGGGLAVLFVAFGFDLAVAYGFSLGVVGDSGLMQALAVSPLSAYRGLVLETAVLTASGTGPQTAAPAASALGLAVWTAGSLLIATRVLD
ncbi:MAG: ABC transporter permease [Natrialbaceae archaeon]